MSKPRKRNIGSAKPATKGDIEQLREDFQSDLVNHSISKDDAKQFATKEDLKSIKDEIINAMNVRMEVRDSELEGKHEIELEHVAGKTDTPRTWKSIPRRLTTVEMDVEKIKDHLEIS